MFYESLPTRSAGRAELPQGVAGAIHDLAGRQKGPIPGRDTVASTGFIQRHPDIPAIELLGARS